MNAQKNDMMTIKYNCTDFFEKAEANNSTTSSSLHSDSFTSTGENTTVKVTNTSHGHKKLRKVGDCIGKGYYGQVKLGCALMKRTQTGEIITKALAVKEILVRRQVPTVVEKFLFREIDVHKRCRHHNIVLLYSHKEYFARGKLDKIRMFCEFCPNGTLLLYVRKYRLVLDNARRWFRQIADAVRYLHHNDICHRDLKCDNILLDEYWNAKLCDFGFAKLCSDKEGKPLEFSSTFCGTAAYVAPELIRNEQYDPKAADVWSLGVVLHYMVTRRLPFGEVASGVFTAHEKVQPTFMIKAATEQHAACIDQLAECDALMRMLLTKNVADRPTASLVLSHTWLQRSDENQTFICGDNALDYEFVEEVDEGNGSNSSTMSLKSSETRTSTRVISHFAAYARPARAVTSKMLAAKKRLGNSLNRNNVDMRTSNSPIVKNDEETVSKNSSSPFSNRNSGESEPGSVFSTELVVKSVGHTTDCGSNEKHSAIVVYHSTCFNSITNSSMQAQQAQLMAFSPSPVIEVSSVATEDWTTTSRESKHVERSEINEQKHKISTAETPAVSKSGEKLVDPPATNPPMGEMPKEEAEKRWQHVSVLLIFRAHLRRLMRGIRNRFVAIRDSLLS